MSKALVIKGASFAANKVETITLTQPIPCTGLSVSPTTVSFTALNATQQLTVTKTPADTTDTVSYASSNENVATVSSSGLVTCVGVGSATITVMCGTQSATCAVTSEIVINGSSLSGFNGYQMTSTDLSADPPKDYGGLYPLEGARIYATTTPTESGRKAFSGSSAYTGIIDSYPIMLPKNTGIIEVSVPSAFSGNGKIMLFDSTKSQTYVQGADTALVVQYTTGVAPSNNKYTFTITAADADSVAIQVRTSSGSASEVTGDVVFTFKASS